MIKGIHAHLRPVRPEDWALFEQWGREREALWDPYQRFQLDHLPLIQQALQQSGLLGREV